MTNPFYGSIGFIEKATVKYVWALTLLLAVSISISNAQTTVFLDFTTNDTIGASIIGQTPDIGLGTLEGQSGGTLQITTNYSIDTVGAARLAYGAFISALGPGQELYLSYNVLNFGPAFPNSGGYAGVSLYTGYSSYSNNIVGNEEEFTGEPNDADQWGLDQATTGLQDSGNTNTPATAIFTYVYDTGAWTFTTSGGVNMSGNGVADQAFDAIRIANGNGADLELNNLRVVIGTAPQVGGTWTAVAQAPPVGLNNCLLLSDGTVLGMDGTGQCARLTPDIHGSYIHGTWTQIASMNFSRLFFSTEMLTNGTVFVAGGEYGDGDQHGEIFDPLRSTWMWIYPDPTPGVGFSDAISETLPNGNVLDAPVSEFGGCLIYDAASTQTGSPILAGALGGVLICNAASNTWQTAASAQNQNEVDWVKLSSDSILTVDAFSQTTEHYVPSLNEWVKDGNLPAPLFSSNGEIGTGHLLPNGTVFYVGSTTNTAIYTPGSTPTSAGSWVAGPEMVFGTNELGASDAPAATLANGNVLFCLGPQGSYNGPCSFYEYVYTNNSFTQIGAPGGGTTYNNTVPFASSMLDLPDGSILFVAGQNSQTLYTYTPTGMPLATGQPFINSIAENADGSYQMTGTNLNGISEGAAYGDDEQMDSNYPLVRMTNNATGNVYYARTFNWNSTGVQTGSRVITTEFALPQNLPSGTYSLVAVVNGEASTPTNFVYSPPSVPTGLVASGSNGFLNLAWNVSSGATAYNVKRSSRMTGYFATLATVSGTSFTDSPLTNGLTYYYKVAAIGSGGPGSDSAAIAATPSGPTTIPGAAQINLSSYYNRTGIVVDGSSFSSGLDAGAYSYSANLLGPAIFWNNLVFTLGPTNASDVVACAEQTINLPIGRFNTLQILATGVNGSQAQTFTVTYTDNSTATFTQSFSDWTDPQSYSGENTVLLMPYRNEDNGTSQVEGVYLSGYIFTLDQTKTVKNITLPNDSNLVILAMQLATDSIPAPLAAYYNRAGIYTDGTTYTNPPTGGLDGSNGGAHAYSGSLLGSWQIWTNTIFDFGPLDTTNAISSTNQTLSLPTGNYSHMRMLAAAVNGARTSETLVVTYTDSSTTTFTQSFSDWTAPQNYPGEYIASEMSHRNDDDGSAALGSFYLYGYDFALNAAKTVQSVQLPNNTGGIANNSSVIITAISLVPEWPPTFNVNPLTLRGATAGQSYSANIATNASDLNGYSMVFAKVSGPSWLTVASNGVLSGTPANTNANIDTFLISVTDTGGLSSTDMVYISVTGAPSFIANPCTMPPIMAGQNFAGTIATNATDPNNGDTAAFSLVSGPGWLSVAVNGALSGEPLSPDVGTNTFVVSVTDQGGLSNSATMYIPVTAAPPILPDISQQGGGLTLNWSGGIAPYQVQMTTNLLNPNWQDIGGTIGGTNFVATPSNNAAFYRVVGQ